MNSPLREAIGHDITGMARLVEAASLGLLDHRTTYHKQMSKGERAAVEIAEGLLLRASRALRKVGLRMTQGRPNETE